MKFKALITILIIFWTNNLVLANEGDSEISFYTGTFDLIDKEGDDKTSLFGIEHKNPKTHSHDNF